MASAEWNLWESSFTIPSPVVSVGIVWDGTANEDVVGIPYLAGPDGTTYITYDETDFYYPMGYISAFRYQSVVSLNFPHADYERSYAGRWRVQTYCNVCDSRGSGWYARKETESNRLHFNFIFVSAGDIGSAYSDPYVQKVISSMSKVFTCNGFEIAELVYWRLDSSDTYVFDIDRNGNGQSDAMDRLFNSYFEDAYYRSRFINVYFVKYIEGGPLGVAGGIPGPFYGPTTHSGIVVNTLGGLSGLGDDDLTVLGETVAHESSHYMGLFHTMERDGYKANVITDVPYCGANMDRDHDGMLTAEECVDYGATNLMFWTAFAKYQPQWKLTAGQRFVLKRSQFTW